MIRPLSAEILDPQSDSFPPRIVLSRALAADRLSHAYLFVGAPGSGRLNTALDLAKCLFCDRPDSGVRPCGECASCRGIDHENHAGVTVFGAKEDKRTIDIDTIRDVCERSHFRREHVFVAILKNADSMTIPAANALLKTLEEPAGEFILILTAQSIGAMLPTVVSRCHRVYFPTADNDEPCEVDPDELEAPLRRGFFANNDLREWSARTVPEAKTHRDRVRAILAELLRRYRAELSSTDGDHVDRAIDRIERFLELRAALDGNVLPDLVLERILSELGAGR